MPKTINAVPESISRTDYLKLIASVGFVPEDLISLSFGPDSIDAVVMCRNEDGNRILDQRLCEPAIYLQDTISIPVIDGPEAAHV